MDKELRRSLISILNEVLGRSPEVAILAEAILNNAKDAPYELIFQYLSGIQVTRETSRKLWLELLSHRKEMQQQLSNMVDIPMAVVDMANTTAFPLRIRPEVELDALRKIRIVADLDPLTGLYNRSYYVKRIKAEIQKAQQAGTDLSLVFFDIDHFKDYNDSFGHEAGDEVLKVWGDILKDESRHIDVASRYGGEEFLLILPETSKEAAWRMAERLAGEFKSRKFQKPVTISAGVATIPIDTDDGKMLFRMADSALYEAKLAGRDRIQPYTSSHSLARRLKVFVARRILRDFQRHKFLYSAVSSIMILSLIFSFWIWKQQYEAESTHWEEIFHDDFKRAEPGSNYSDISGKTFIKDGQLVITGQTKINIPHDDNVRVEYEAMVPEGIKICDISTFLYVPFNLPFENRGYFLGFGSNNNQYCKLMKNGQVMASTLEPRIVPGKWYRIACEFDNDRLQLEVDHQKVLSLFDYFSPKSEDKLSVVLYTYYSEVHIRKLRIYRRSVPARTKALSIGNAFYSKGLYADAASIYQTIWEDHRETTNGNAALFRLGLCRIREQNYKEAEKCFKLLRLQKNPGKWAMPALYKQAEVLLYQERFEDAISMVRPWFTPEKGRGLQPLATEFLETAARLLSKKKRVKLYMAVHGMFFSAYPQHPDVLFGYFWLHQYHGLRRMNEWDQAIKVLERGLAHPNMNRERLYGMSTHLHRARWRGQYDEVRFKAAEALGYQGYAASTLFGLGRIKEAYNMAESVLNSEDDQLQRNGAMNVVLNYYRVRRDFSQFKKLLINYSETGRNRELGIYYLIHESPRQALRNILDLGSPDDVNQDLLLLAYLKAGDIEKAKLIAGKKMDSLKGQDINYSDLRRIFLIDADQHMKWLESSGLYPFEKEDDYLLMAEGALMKGNKKEAVRWFRKVRELPFGWEDLYAEKRMKQLRLR